MIDNDVLARSGLYLDEMTKKLRFLHPDHHQQSEELVIACEEYLENTEEFRRNVENIFESMNRLMIATDKAKRETFGKRSRLVSFQSDHDMSENRLKQEIEERKAELERLGALHKSLIRSEGEQQDLLARLARK